MDYDLGSSEPSEREREIDTALADLGPSASDVREAVSEQFRYQRWRSEKLLRDASAAKDEVREMKREIARVNSQNDKMLWVIVTLAVVALAIFAVKRVSG